MLSEKEKYHQSIALEFKNKIDRLGFFLPFENGTIYHKFRSGVEEGLPINDIKDILKELFTKEVGKNGMWDIFVTSLLEEDPNEYMRANIQNSNGNTDESQNRLKNRRNILTHYFTNNDLNIDKIIYLYNKIRTLTPRNVQNYPEGNYREYLLIEHLRKILPSTVEVGTGFIIDENYHTTNQIDIIVYDANIAPLFRSGDLVVVVPKSVFGIIEVKTTHYPNKLNEELKKANQNFELIKKSIGNENRTEIFNGIFYFKSSLTVKNIEDSCKTVQVLREFEEESFVANHIAFGDSVFVRKNYSSFSFYDMKEGNLAFAYFFSNLIDIIMRKKNLTNEALSKFIFPIDGDGGKEGRKII
ncbi:DUF6602 domain-containing protein [Bacillus sp. AFS041924]|uniref:DUF6602 domain-containing protein n=1 Tax=Bacillus sp. AFS041924 TaxID=2033503 RepID=UPI000BFEA428|nr:DUF6602 domain-containing protein [Bacillus sp. AFS041924]PGS49894.1 hypothetical protein COC46_14185 [Bacillus sp. AFS041924]